MFDLWDIGQHVQIKGVQQDVNDASRRANQGIESAEDANDRVQRLALLCQAMWELLSERCNLTNEDLVRRVVEVDRRDGCEDNRMSPKVVDCPQCKNKVSTRRPKCVFCGSVLVTKQPFET